MVGHPLVYSNQDFVLSLGPSICQIFEYYFVVRAVVVAVIEAVLVAVVWWLVLTPIAVEELGFQFLVVSFSRLLGSSLRRSFIPFLSSLLSL